MLGNDGLASTFLPFLAFPLAVAALVGDKSRDLIYFRDGFVNAWSNTQSVGTSGKVYNPSENNFMYF